MVKGFGANHWISATLLAERDRWLLWMPVFRGAGTGLYFGLWPIAIAAAVMTLGFNAAAWRTFDAGHTILQR